MKGNENAGTVLLSPLFKAACVVVGSRNCERHCPFVLTKRPKRQGINGEGESGRRPKGKEGELQASFVADGVGNLESSRVLMRGEGEL